MNVAARATATDACLSPGSGVGGAGGLAGFALLPTLLALFGTLVAAYAFLRVLPQKLADLPDSVWTTRVPHRVGRKTTVGEWVGHWVTDWVLVTRTIWHFVTTAVPRFIDVLKQVIEQVWHSEWVASTIWVLQTIYQTVSEYVPLFGWLGAIIGWIWQTVIKPVLTWVAQTIYTLKTWVENVVHWVVERVQDGWNYINTEQGSCYCKCRCPLQRHFFIFFRY